MGVGSAIRRHPSVAALRLLQPPADRGWGVSCANGNNQTVMKQQAHTGPLKVAGYVLMGSSIFIMLGELVASSWSFRALLDALKEGFYVFLLGLFFASTAASSERIRQLQEENAALRAKNRDSGASQDTGV